MNGTCAGGTGAFADQMATLMQIDTGEMNELAKKYEKIYSIASRCGVFAKTDIQPLLNQGAKKEDLAASVYQAVVNQTIAGLAQGRLIKGKVMFLGGPLYYCKGLRDRFKETLKLSKEEAIFPDYALYSVSMGASMYANPYDENVIVNKPYNNGKSEAKKTLIIINENIKNNTEFTICPISVLKDGRATCYVDTLITVKIVNIPNLDNVLVTSETHYSDATSKLLKEMVENL